MMQSISVQSHIGNDGILKLQIPVGVSNVDVEVMVIMHPLTIQSTQAPAVNHPESPGFFEKTFGCLTDFPEIETEGKYEVREEMG